MAFQNVMFTVPEVWRDPGAESTIEVVRQNHTFETIKDILDKGGVDDTHAFALMALDARGNVRVHISGPLKRHVDESLLFSHFQRACEVSSREERAPGPNCLDEGSNARGVNISTKPRNSCYIPRQGLGYSTAPNLPPLKDEADDSRTVIKSFHIGDTEQVKSFIISRLKLMQQLADKKIAKAWIKGICTKKQALFPYQNTKLEIDTGEKPEVPQWWADPILECRFIEPDHIRKDERLRLLRHFLRLRPSPEKLREWNYYQTEINQTHVEHGWTAFLSEQAGAEIFDGLPKESVARTRRRKMWMRQMYAVAEMEEALGYGAVDGKACFSYQEYEEDDKSGTARQLKRSHQECEEALHAVTAKPSKRLCVHTEALPSHQAIPPQVSLGNESIQPQFTAMGTDVMANLHQFSNPAAIWGTFEPAPAPWIDPTISFGEQQFASEDTHGVHSRSWDFLGNFNFGSEMQPLVQADFSQTFPNTQGSSPFSPWFSGP